MLKDEHYLSHDDLLSLLRYDPFSGVFHWKISTSSRIRVGAVAGSARNGYRVVRINTRLYYAHRLAWFYVHQKWPTDDIDHKNRVRDDNRIENLREATRSQNHMNRTVADRNVFGMKGVSRNGSRWYMARIAIDGVQIYLGNFKTPEEAHAAYAAASLKHHKEFGRTA